MVQLCWVGVPTNKLVFLTQKRCQEVCTTGSSTSAALRFSLVHFSVYSSSEDAFAFSKPKPLSLVADPPNLQACFSAQLSQQTSPHQQLNVFDTAVQAVSCRLITWGLSNRSWCYPKLLICFKGYNFLHPLEGNHTHCLRLGNRPILHRLSRPLGNYGRLFPTSCLLTWFPITMTSVTWLYRLFIFWVRYGE